MNILQSIKNFDSQRGGVKREVIEAYQKKLFNEGMANIPLSYTGLLEEVNGVRFEELEMFGIEPEGESDLDIYKRNSIAGAMKQRKVIFLGDNFNEYLCYDWSCKSYLILSKESEEIMRSFEIFGTALEFFLRDYLR